jgi:predicted tellurium resistance membrane protein TerC
VVLSGGILGIVMMRLVIGQLLALVERYPPLVDAAFIVIAWVAIKLLVEYLHAEGFIGFDVPRWLSLLLIVVIFGIAFIYARSQERRVRKASKSDEAAKELLIKEGERN